MVLLASIRVESNFVSILLFKRLFIGICNAETVYLDSTVNAATPRESLTPEVVEAQQPQAGVASFEPAVVPLPESFGPAGLRTPFSPSSTSDVSTCESEQSLLQPPQVTSSMSTLSIQFEGQSEWCTGVLQDGRNQLFA